MGSSVLVCATGSLMCVLLWEESLMSAKASNETCTKDCPFAGRKSANYMQFDVQKMSMDPSVFITPSKQCPICGEDSEDAEEHTS